MHIFPPVRFKYKHDKFLISMEWWWPCHIVFSCAVHIVYRGNSDLVFAITKTPITYATITPKLNDGFACALPHSYSIISPTTMENEMSMHYSACFPQRNKHVGTNWGNSDRCHGDLVPPVIWYPGYHITGDLVPPGYQITGAKSILLVIWYPRWFGTPGIM